MSEQLIPMVLLPAAIEDFTGEPCPRGVRVLREMGADKLIPATRLENGQWRWKRSDLPAIVAAVTARVLARS